MSLIRGVTMTILLSFILVASAAGSFVYLLSGYPSPEVDSFNVTSNDTLQETLTVSEVSIKNLGAQGEVTAQFRVLEDGGVVDSREQTFSMTRNEVRVVREEFTGENIDNLGLAVFAPGRPELVQDRSEITERINFD